MCVEEACAVYRRGVCACVDHVSPAGLSCQRTCVQWQGKSMNQCPVCRQYAFPKLRSVEMHSVTLITPSQLHQVPSQVCKYDVMCMELRTCHAESFAGLQIYIMCMELRAVLHRVPRTVCKYNTSYSRCGSKGQKLAAYRRSRQAHSGLRGL